MEPEAGSVRRGGGVLACQEVGVDQAGREVNGPSEVGGSRRGGEDQGSLKPCARRGFQGRASSVVCICELLGREEWSKWVTHKAVTGADVVVREKGCRAVFEEDLFV